MVVISYLQSGGERVPWEGGDGWRVVMMGYLEGEANRYPWKCKDRRTQGVTVKSHNTTIAALAAPQGACSLSLH